MIACILAGYFSYSVKGQDQSLADSLIHVVDSRNDLSDSTICALLNKISFNSTNPDREISYAEQAIIYAKRIGNERLLAQSLRNVGNGKRSKGNLASAIDYYLRAGLHYSNIGLELGVAVVYLDLGEVYRKQDNFDNSKLYYNKSIDILRSENDSIRLGSVLLNTGELYRIHDLLDTAMLYFDEAESIFRKINFTSRIAYTLGNKGLVFAKQGKNEQAEKNIVEAIQVLEELSDFDPIAIYQISLADIYEQRGDLKKALNYAHSALNIGQEEGLKEQIRDASLKLSELYQTQGYYRKAYNYQSQYITYRDSINNDEVIRKIADLRTEYEVSKKQAEVDLKQTEVDLLNEQARNNQIVLWSVIVILVLVLFLMYALLKIYRVKVRAIRIVKKRREIITAQRNQLAEANQTKDKFFSIISHDIRGPISNFHGVSQLIQLLVESDDKEALLKLGRMLDTSTSEVSSLLDNLLEWAMSQQGRMPYKPEKIKLHQLCNSNLGIMQNLAAAKQIKLTKKVKEKVTIQADKNSVSTIIRNLISNAIKFTPEGGKVDITLSYEITMAVISIQDSGIGIPQEKMSHLFDFKGERSRWGTEGEKGVGLGLTLVNEFVELNNGRVEVESQEGKGTTFKIYLPILSE